jgi:hypothetical protein
MLEQKKQNAEKNREYCILRYPPDKIYSDLSSAVKAAAKMNMEKFNDQKTYSDGGHKNFVAEIKAEVVTTVKPETKVIHKGLPQNLWVRLSGKDDL